MGRGGSMQHHFCFQMICLQQEKSSLCFGIMFSP